MPDRLVVLYRGSLPPATGLIERLADTVYATEEELPLLLPGADALLAWETITPAVREAWPDNPEKAPRWVHAAATGVDSFLFPALVEDPGVTLTNASGVYDEPIAEYVLGPILAMAKDFPGTWEQQQRREWRPHQGEIISGSTALVWGTGPIGRATAPTCGLRRPGRAPHRGQPGAGETAGEGEALIELFLDISRGTSRAVRCATSSTNDAGTWRTRAWPADAGRL
jgi:phosphoglycerate dehydrogenase-like enzyme